MTNNIRFRVGDILQERQIKQKDFAVMTGLSQNAVSDITTNAARQIRLATIVKICRALDIQPGDLFELHNNGNK